MKIEKITNCKFNGNWKENINSKNVVYCITNLINNKKYIGVAKNLRTRLIKYRSDIKNNINRAIIIAIKKYSFENFSFDIIEKLNSYDECLSREIELISEFKRNNYILYNRTRGGEGVVAPQDQFPNNTKLNESNFEEIFDLYHNKKISPREIGKQFNVKYGVIYSLLKGKTFSFLARKIREKFPRTRKSNEIFYTDNTSGLNNYQSKIKYNDLESIFNLYHNLQKSSCEIAKIHNIEKGSVLLILKGRTYKQATKDLINKYGNKLRTAKMSKSLKLI